MSEIERLKRHEGFRAKPYRCSAGKLTIGYGLNLDAGISKEVAELLLMHEVSRIENELGKFHWFRNISFPRQNILINMAYNMGIEGLLGFKKMIKALQQKDFAEAKRQMLDSKWAREDVPNRANELAEEMWSE